MPRAEILRFLAGELHVGEDWLVGKEPQEKSKVSGDAAVSGGKEMREFKKSSKLEHVLYDVRGPVVEEAARMEGEGTQILKLNIGNPAPFGFRTPDEVIYDMRQQLTECEGYSSAKGLFLPGRRSCSMHRSRSCRMFQQRIFIQETVSVN